MIVGAVPGVYGWLRQAVWIWTLVALVIAVRQSLDYDDTLKAVVVCVLAQLIIVAAFMVVGFLGFGAAMFGSAM
jgi:hypothetical protein